MSSLVKNLLLFIGVLVVLSLIFTGLKLDKNKIESVSLDKIITQLQNQEIKKIEVEGDIVRATLKDDKIEEAKKETGDTFGSIVKNYNVDPEKLKQVEVAVKSESSFAFWMGTLLP